jgi:hypothetical protein
MKNMTIWVTALALGAGCSKKKDNEPAPTGSAAAEPTATKTVETKAPAGGEIPTPFAMPKAGDKFQGVWDARLSVRTSGTMSIAGDPAAVKIEGDKATVWDGKEEHQVGFAVTSPCTIQFSVEKKDGKYFFDRDYVVVGDDVQIAQANVGYRKGTQAFVCFGNGIVVVDEKGGCAKWENHFDKWESKPETCAWSGDTLKIGTGDWVQELKAEGDVLESDQFREEVKQGAFKKATDWDATKAKVTADVKSKDPLEIAKAAGGKVGETSTVASLAATLASDPSIKGKQVEVKALFLNTSTSTSNGQTSVIASLIGAKDQMKPSMSCRLDKDVKGLKQYDKVVAKGTVDEMFDEPSLTGCTLTKAK